MHQDFAFARSVQLQRFHDERLVRAMHDGGADIHWHDAVPLDLAEEGEPTHIVGMEQSVRSPRFDVLMNLDFRRCAVRNRAGLCNPAAVARE
ncbi:hypothetical protein GCM10011487_65840 [Steroidobacter agaridevorans]|uniref:Uncharacterized protein n=1 Tax=Steroidobacter agaridevorans TaxID=2695856 RepID=A0A829YMA9_9GAMM|nr:hypothetical protein GCM10011487_65840 [Steroidobacter agaridevorans]GFE90983.1 hypothetical protein GCM10011488_59370 [Steroidobacter agaridevorans]